jgi:hypothetical protein
VENPVKTYLRARMFNARKCAHAGFTPSDIPLISFVLKYGQAFQAAPRPKGVRKGRAGSCFANALVLAMDKNLNYTYVEGYGCYESHVVHHAWCINDRKEVLDRTWDKSEECSYFGIPFRASFIREHVRQTKVLESVITLGDLGAMNPRSLAMVGEFKQELDA